MYDYDAMEKVNLFTKNLNNQSMVLFSNSTFSSNVWGACVRGYNLNQLSLSRDRQVSRSRLVSNEPRQADQILSKSKREGVVKEG